MFCTKLAEKNMNLIAIQECVIFSAMKKENIYIYIYIYGQLFNQTFIFLKSFNMFEVLAVTAL